MLFRVIGTAVLASSICACDVFAGDAPTSLTVSQKLESQPEFVSSAGLDKERRRKNIDTVVATTPPAIAEAVNQWTGISDRGKTVTVKFFHTLHNSRFDAMSFGDGYGYHAYFKRAGKTLSAHDTNVRYREALTASDETSFFVVGIHEYENRVTKRKCYVICQLQGEKPVSEDPQDAIIHPTGTAIWFGPVVNVPSVLFSDDEDTARKR